MDAQERTKYPEIEVQLVGQDGNAVGPRAGRFFNRRAEAAWELRELLEAGHRWEQRRRSGENPGRLVGLALPPANRDRLIRELCAIEWTIVSNRKIQLESKAIVKTKLGRGESPDYFDALCMGICTDGTISFDVPSQAVAF